MTGGVHRFRFYRPVDLIVGASVLIGFAPVILLSQLVCAIATRSSGLFHQSRIGRDGEPFTIVKLRTMTQQPRNTTEVRPASTVTTASDARITRSGRLVRRFKLDELPQMVNVIKGDMSLVGPRPDVAGFADNLVGTDRRILTVRPGITGAATIFFRDEERVLDGCLDADEMSATLLFPLKVHINRAWFQSGTLRDDVHLLVWTVRPPNHSAIEAMFNRWDPSISTSQRFLDYVELRA